MCILTGIYIINLTLKASAVGEDREKIKNFTSAK